MKSIKQKLFKTCSTCDKICIRNYYKCKCGNVFCYLHINEGHLYYLLCMKPDCEYFTRSRF